MQHKGKVAEQCSNPASRGLVLGVYADENDRLDIGVLTPTAAKYNEVSSGNSRDLYGSKSSSKDVLVTYAQIAVIHQWAASRDASISRTDA